MNWSQIVEENKQQILQDLQKLIQIPSILDEKQTSSTYPFGEEPYKALQWMLEDGEKNGFTTKDVDHYAGHIEMGQGEELLGILCHVDVVPAGEGWTYPPFEGKIVDDRLYGRGAIDDKGPTIAAWNAMKLIRKMNIPLSKRVRLIIGTDEESGFRCVHHYFEKEEMPTYAFAPDADFPIINAEKGIAVVRYTTKQVTENEILLSFESGVRTNMVPDYAKARIQWSDVQIDEAFQTFLSSHHVEGNVTTDANVRTFELHGKSAHAMEPNAGINAGILLATFLSEFITNGTSHDFLQFCKAAFYNDTRGQYVQLNYSDEQSGDTTCNAGVLRFDSKTDGTIDVSLRYSVSYPFEEKWEQSVRFLEEKAMRPTIESNDPPHYVDENEPWLQTLASVYEKHTGEKANMLAIGGGTYARVLENGVAFGMLFPGEEDVAHQKDEFVSVSNLLKATAIYAEAICALASEEE